MTLQEFFQKEPEAALAFSGGLSHRTFSTKSKHLYDTFLSVVT